MKRLLARQLFKITRAIQRLLPYPKTRIYVVFGEQIREFEEPSYSTDPSDYDFDLFKYETKSPDSFPPLPWDLPSGTAWERQPVIIKVFRTAYDAIGFAYCCNLASVFTIAYDWQNGLWVHSDDQSDFDIDW